MKRGTPWPFATRGVTLWPELQSGEDPASPAKGAGSTTLRDCELCRKMLSGWRGDTSDSDTGEDGDSERLPPRPVTVRRVRWRIQVDDSVRGSVEGAASFNDGRPVSRGGARPPSSRGIAATAPAVGTPLADASAPGGVYQQGVVAQAAQEKLEPSPAATASTACAAACKMAGVSKQAVARRAPAPPTPQPLPDRVHSTPTMAPISSVPIAFEGTPAAANGSEHPAWRGAALVASRSRSMADVGDACLPPMSDLETRGPELYVLSGAGQAKRNSPGPTPSRSQPASCAVQSERQTSSGRLRQLVLPKHALQVTMDDVRSNDAQRRAGLLRKFWPPEAAERIARQLFVAAAGAPPAHVCSSDATDELLPRSSTEPRIQRAGRLRRMKAGRPPEATSGGLRRDVSGPALGRTEGIRGLPTLDLTARSDVATSHGTASPPPRLQTHASSTLRASAPGGPADAVGLSRTSDSRLGLLSAEPVVAVRRSEHRRSASLPFLPAIDTATRGVLTGGAAER